jgi:type I restriction enzyme S subunit
MKYPAYPKYKDSGVAWLGEVPKHWESISLKWVSRLYAGGTPDKSNDSYWEDGFIPWLNSGSVNDGNITQPSALITHEGFLNSSAKWIPEKSLVIALAGQGKTKGMVAQLGIRATCNQSMAAIIPSSKVYPRYLYWWLTSNYQNIRNMAGGEQRDGLNLVMVGSIPCPLFPIAEQTAIAEFLDRETGRIDTLVAKKRKLVELLKEKRSALISRTVTRGLPADAAREFGLEPHTSFKQSDVEWLGEVPAAWNVKRLSYLALLKSGEGITSEQIAEGGDFPVYGGNGLRGFYSAYTHDGFYALIGRQGALCGNVNYASGKFWASEHAIVVIPLVTFESKWLGELLRAMNLNQYSVSAAQPGLSVSILGALRIPVPPLAEQTAIANYLDRETAKIDRLVEKVETAMTRLQECRAALITAAVTGKIDVREYV